jgi:hypothetical protein
MTWRPIGLTDLESMILRDLADCSDGERELFERVRIPPAKWRLTPWGDDGGGFWAVAIHQDRVLWYNDIEEGFNVSRFEVPGEIPCNEYWCNQDPLRCALPRLQGEAGTLLAPPEPVDNA